MHCKSPIRSANLNWQSKFCSRRTSTHQVAASTRLESISPSKQSRTNANIAPPLPCFLRTVVNRQRPRTEPAMAPVREQVVGRECFCGLAAADDESSRPKRAAVEETKKSAKKRRSLKPPRSSTKTTTTTTTTTRLNGSKTMLKNNKKTLATLVLLACLAVHQWRDFAQVSANSQQLFAPNLPVNQAKSVAGGPQQGSAGK